MYSIVITEYAIRQLKKINKQMVASIKATIAELAHDPRPHNHIKLTNLEAYRVRVGNYRIIYEINDTVLTITVVEVADRNKFTRKSNAFGSLPLHSYSLKTSVKTTALPFQLILFLTLGITSLSNAYPPAMALLWVTCCPTRPS